MQAAVESARPLIEQHSHKLTETISHPAMQVHGDPSRLQQAISNLLVNSAKYTPPGGQIHLNVSQDDRQAVIQVQDNGVGIAPEQIHTIFDLFVQSDRTLHRSKGGMGVGLTLVRSIIDQHEGTVTVRSDGHGAGSCFEIRLPRLMEVLEQALERPEEPVATPTPPNACIVIVEDQDDNREMLQALLQLEGYRVFTAENGLKGVAAIEQHQPDLVLIDIGLPGLNGFEVAKQVRGTFGNRRTYLVVLTGYGQSQDVQAAFDAGFDSHMVKPLDCNKLKHVLGLCQSANSSS